MIVKSSWINIIVFNMTSINYARKIKGDFRILGFIKISKVIQQLCFVDNNKYLY